MSNSEGAVGRDEMMAMEQGPWGGRAGGSGSDAGTPQGDGARPNNPWNPSGDGKAPRGRGPSLEDLLRRGGSSFGKGGGGLPSLGGRPWWAIALAAIIVLWVATSSIHLIGAEEQGVVSTFGRYNRTVGPGPAFTFPAPIERLEKVDTQQIRTLQVGTAEGARENHVLTADQNIIDMAYEVRWSITDPERFLFALSDPEAALRDVAESAMRATVANYGLAQAIGSGRSEIEAEVRQRMQQILKEYDAGITVSSIAIRQSDPPDQVKEAFNNVNAAKQKSESYLNDARAYARQVIERAQGDTAAFDKVYEQYRLAPEVTRRRMYYETMESVLANVDKTIVENNGVQTYLPLSELRRRSPPPPAASAPATQEAR